MTEGMPIYFPKDLYHRSKIGFKGLLDSFGLEWDSIEKAWIGKAGKIVGVFEGHKKPALLYVSGNESLIEQAKEFANMVKAEIREAEVKDIKDKRKEEGLLKKEREEREKKEAENRAKKSDECLEDPYLTDDFVGADLWSHYRTHQLLKGMPDNWGIKWSDRELKVDIKKVLSVDEDLAWDILVQCIKTTKEKEPSSDLIIAYKLCEDEAERTFCKTYKKKDVMDAIDTMIKEGYIEVLGVEGDGRYLRFIKKPLKPKKDKVG